MGSRINRIHFVALHTHSLISNILCILEEQNLQIFTSPKCEHHKFTGPKVKLSGSKVCYPAPSKITWDYGGKILWTPTLCMDSCRSTNSDICSQIVETSIIQKKTKIIYLSTQVLVP